MVRICSIRSVPLNGRARRAAGIEPEDSVHALVAVRTDAGITGYGSVFTDGRLVEAGFKVLEPLFSGENALEPEPERVTEKLH